MNTDRKPPRGIDIRPSSAKPPFTVGETLHRFQKHVSQLLKSHTSRGVALALSGGVDSIALAWLWHTSRQAKDASAVFKLPFHAVVVDHRLRPESYTEAQLTARRFESITGGKAHIVRLDDHLLKNKSNWETEARKLRYRALAKVCISEGLNTVLAGHHADDQVETILHRLLEQYRKGTTNGLAGMAADSPLPECSNIHGAQSTDHVAHTWISSSIFDNPGAHLYEPLSGATIRLVRPLLPFRKADLRALCESMDLDWAEDSTNKDSTLTTRNALRKILESGDLPRAIQPSRVLRIREAAKAADELEYENVRDVHQAMEHGKKFDCSLGVLQTPLPDFTTMPQSLALTYLRDIVGAIGTGVPSRMACSGMLHDLKAWQKVEEASQMHRRKGDFDLLETASMIRGRTLWHELAKAAAIDGLKWEQTQMDFETGKTRVQKGVIGAAILGGHERKTHVDFNFFRVSHSGSQEHGPIHPELHLERREDTQGGFFCNPDYPNPTIWDGRFWVKLRVSPNLIHDNGLVVSHLRHDYRTSFETSESALTRALNLWIRYQRKYYKGFPMIPSLNLVPNKGTGALDCSAGRDYADRILAVPAAGYVKTGFELQIQMEVAHKGLGDAGIAASIVRSQRLRRDLHPHGLPLVDCQNVSVSR